MAITYSVFPKHTSKCLDSRHVKEVFTCPSTLMQAVFFFVTLSALALENGIWKVSFSRSMLKVFLPCLW